MGRRCIGLCTASSRRSRSGRTAWSARRGQIALCDETFRIFAEGLGPEDAVAIEATCNTHVIVRVIEPHVARLGNHTRLHRVRHHHKVKIDKVDAAVLAELLAADYLPSPMRAPRRCAARSSGAPGWSGSALGSRTTSRRSCIAIWSDAAR